MTQERTFEDTVIKIAEEKLHKPCGLPSDWDDNDFVMSPAEAITFAQALYAEWSKTHNTPSTKG